MRIFVTCLTASRAEGKPRRAFVTGGAGCVAGETGDCLVCTAERVIGLLMLGHQEASW